MRLLLSSAFAASLVVVLFACSESSSVSPNGDDAGGGGPGPLDSGLDARGVDSPDAPSSAADAGPDAHVFTGPTYALPAAASLIGTAECGFLERCFTVYTNEYTGSVAGCNSGAATTLAGDYASGALFDQVAVDATVKCIAALSCDALYGGAYQAKCATPKPVNAAPLGAACNKDNDCDSVHCTGQSTGACGTCAPSLIVKVGDACGGSTLKRCPLGAACRGTCVTEKELGETCDSDLMTSGSSGTAPCGELLACVSGKCATQGGPGAACSDSSACDPYQLQACDKTSGLCADIQWLAAGAACLTGDDSNMCGGGLRCVAPSGTTSGTCQTAIQPGQACVRTSSCTFGYTCASNVCVPDGSTRPICK